MKRAIFGSISVKLFRVDGILRCDTFFAFSFDVHTLVAVLRPAFAVLNAPGTTWSTEFHMQMMNAKRFRLLRLFERHFCSLKDTSLVSRSTSVASPANWRAPIAKLWLCHIELVLLFSHSHFSFLFLCEQIYNVLLRVVGSTIVLGSNIDFAFVTRIKREKRMRSITERMLKYFCYRPFG